MSEQVTELQKLREHDLLDLDIVLTLKQGQVEVEQAAVVTDYADSVLVHRQVIQDVNRQIIQLGGEKLQILTQVKGFGEQVSHRGTSDMLQSQFHAFSITVPTRLLHRFSFSLAQVKDFRKNKFRLKWENDKADLEEEEMTRKTRDFQLLRVTKSLQATLP